MSQVFFFSYAEDTNPLKGLQRLIAKSTFEEMIPRKDRFCELYPGYRPTL